MAHSTAKTGITGIARQRKMEGRAHGIRANSISPGVIETSESREQRKDPEWSGYMLGKTLLGRLGQPEEEAKLALFRASDDNSYVTGVDIVVDGGVKVRRSFGRKVIAHGGSHFPEYRLSSRQLACVSLVAAAKTALAQIGGRCKSDGVLC